MALKESYDTFMEVKSIKMMEALCSETVLFWSYAMHVYIWPSELAYLCTNPHCPVTMKNPEIELSVEVYHITSEQG